MQRPERLEATISVRFSPGEIEPVRARAGAAGREHTADVRRCVAALERPPIDRGELSRSVAAPSRDLEELRCAGAPDVARADPRPQPAGAGCAAGVSGPGAGSGPLRVRGCGRGSGRCPRAERGVHEQPGVDPRRRAALPNVGGNTLGLVVQGAAAVALGPGTVIERSAEASSALWPAGAAHPIWLGVQAIRHRRALVGAVAGQLRPLPPLRAVRDGVVVGGVAKPETIAVLVVVMPQFATPGPGHLAPERLVLGLVLPLIAPVLDGYGALAAGAARQWLSGSPPGPPPSAAPGVWS